MTDDAVDHPKRRDPTASSVCQVLNAAADLLERPGGWVKGRLSSINAAGDLCYCVIGALTVAAGHGGYEVRNAAERKLMASIGNKPLASWNDTMARTQAEVVAALRAAAQSEAPQ